MPNPKFFEADAHFPSVRLQKQNESCKDPRRYSRPESYRGSFSSIPSLLQAPPSPSYMSAERRGGWEQHNLAGQDVVEPSPEIDGRPVS